MKSLTINPRWRIALVMATIPIGIALGSQNQVRAIAAASAQSTAWQAVIAADKAEISALNAATSAAMKKGDPNAVVAAQQLIVSVSARLANEKRSSSFPPGFEPATNTTGLAQPELKLELARDKAVADAIISADQRKIASINASVAKDMKAGKAQLVVGDMSQLKTAQFQLAQDKAAAAMLLPRAVPTGAVNQPSPLFHPGGLPIGGQTVSQEQGHAVGDAIPADQWPKMLAEAMKPVEWNSVPALAAELSRYQTNPKKIIGHRVTAFLKTDAAGNLVIAGSTTATGHLSRQLRIQRLRLRNQIIQHFTLIRKEARLRKKAEYRWQLDILKREAPNAMGWQVNQSLIFGEKRECSTVTAAAYKMQRTDLRLVALAFHGTQSGAQMVAPAGGKTPSSGAVYGVVVGISSQSVSRETPQFSLPSGQQLRSQVYFRPLPQTAPPAGFLANVPALNVPSQQIPPCTAYTVKILYCARSPHYFQPKKVVALLPITGYVFKMKSGTKMEATTYTTGDFYYHLKWNGINLSVAKDLVVKIIPVR
jgi:hypothetical protein